MSTFYNQEGYAQFPLLNSQAFEQVRQHAISKLQTLFKQHYANCDFQLAPEKIAHYHTWGCQTTHSAMLRASNRHWNPPLSIQQILINQQLAALLKDIGVKKFKIWDEGLGWLGFRLIRPNHEDGYPFSCKNWGAAKNVISLWIPLIGFEPAVSLNIMPGSHKKEFPKHRPQSKFTADEYRLNYIPYPEECLRPHLQPGEALIFHPQTLHAEQVGPTAHTTRFSLEFRVLPL